MTHHSEDECPDREMLDSLFRPSNTTYLPVALLMLIIHFPSRENRRFGRDGIGASFVRIDARL